MNGILGALLVVAALMSTTGCDSIEDVFDREKEAKGAIEEVGADYLVVDAIRYAVTERTTFDGISGIADLSAGQEVEIEYEEAAGARTALEVELGGSGD